MSAIRLQLLDRKQALGISYRDLSKIIGKSHTSIRDVLMGNSTPFPLDREGILASVDAALTEAERETRAEAA